MTKYISNLWQSKRWKTSNTSKSVHNIGISYLWTRLDFSLMWLSP